MQQFLQGRAPLHILNVEHNQEVNVDMDLKQEQDYVAPKKKYRPFEGRGQRLGSPTPGTTTSSSSTSAPAPSSSSATPAGASGYQPASVNESEPTVTFRFVSVMALDCSHGSIPATLLAMFTHLSMLPVRTAWSDLMFCRRHFLPRS